MMMVASVCTALYREKVNTMALSHTGVYVHDGCFPGLMIHETSTMAAMVMLKRARYGQRMDRMPAGNSLCATLNPRWKKGRLLLLLFFLLLISSG